MSLFLFGKLVLSGRKVWYAWDMGKKKAEKLNTMPSNGEEKGRDEASGRFVKGWKGGGRKKIPDEVKELLQAATPDAVRFLAALVNDDTAKDTDRVKAAEIILDRVYGKPQQSVDIDAKSIPQVVFVGAEDLK